MSKVTGNLKVGLFCILHPFRTLTLLAFWALTAARFAGKQPHPRNSVADYENRFRGKLGGHWDTAVFTVCPVDTAISFLADGTGAYCAGAGGMLGGDTDFKWRQVGDFEIELSLAEGEERWSKVTYSFFSSGQEIKIRFEPEDGAEEWIYEFAYDVLPLSSL
jgi:hypothetical protein